LLAKPWHAALTQAGHTVYGGISPRQTPRNALQVPMDFARDTVADFWLPRLEGMDAVVNAVGVLRDSRARPIEAVHRDTPIALFEACAQAGVQRVVQVSALGIDGSTTAYARTKRATEERLWALAAQHKLQPAILRPSVVFGRGGDSTRPVHEFGPAACCAAAGAGVGCTGAASVGT
jgi:nucleoside-diphosphate-sugar epimerase